MSESAPLSIDQQVAREVMGYEVNGRLMTTEHIVSALPLYSTQMAYAWQLVEELERRGWRLRLVNQKLSTLPQLWTASFLGLRMYHGQGGSAPEAICLAALAAVRAETDV